MNIRQYVVGTLCIAVVATAGYAVPVSAQTTDQAAMMAQIEQLMKLIAELQAKLKTAQDDLEELIKDGLAEGMTDDDIKKVQELLATDPSIYPAGLVTGYFGPMTREAIRRFQERMDLEVTGTLNKETREAIMELRKERVGGFIPPGLLQSQAVRERVRAKLAEKWGECDYNRPVRAALCEKIKDGRDDDDDDDDDENEDEDDKESDIDRNKARSAISKAADAIEDLEEQIEEAEDDNVDEEVVEAAQDDLEMAQEYLTEARRAYADRKYDLAYTKAKQAEEMAEDAEEALEEEDDDDDYDDEDDDDDDDDDEDDNS